MPSDCRYLSFWYLHLHWQMCAHQLGRSVLLNFLDKIFVFAFQKMKIKKKSSGSCLGLWQNEISPFLGQYLFNVFFSFQLNAFSFIFEIKSVDYPSNNGLITEKSREILLNWTKYIDWILVKNSWDLIMLYWDVNSASFTCAYYIVGSSPHDWNRWKQKWSEIFFLFNLLRICKFYPLRLYCGNRPIVPKFDMFIIWQI